MASCIRRVVWMVASLWSMDGLEGAVVELRVVPGLDDVVGLAVGPVLDVRAFTDRAFFAFFV